jgi:hypothetical protein
MKTERIAVSRDAYNVGIYCEMCESTVSRALSLHEHVARDNAWKEAEKTGYWVRRDTPCGRNITAFFCGPCMRAAVWSYAKREAE